MVYKGNIASVSVDNTARIIPDGTPEKTVSGIVIPSHLRGKLDKNHSVLYAYFSDGEGIIISRMDGENNG